MPSVRAHCALAVVPAAGVGRRLRVASTPTRQHPAKQYLALADSTVIEHTLRVLLESPRVERIVVGINPLDAAWHELSIASHPKIRTVIGGGERTDTVLNCLHVFPPHEYARWVMVHDAVRPCLQPSDIELLWGALEDSVGGLLATPLTDTIKRGGADGNVLATVVRDQLWAGQTPQMFRLGQLLSALQDARARGLMVTDEASAMEAAGMRPRLVAGSARNIKITHAEDLALAEFYLRRQGQGDSQ